MERTAELGWKDSIWALVTTILGLATFHELADVLLSRYVSGWVAGILVTVMVVVLGSGYAVSILTAHKQERVQLKQAIDDRALLHQESSELLQELNSSIATLERQNQQLRQLAYFTHRIHACQTEQEILAVSEELLPKIVETERGLLFCPTPEGSFRAVMEWPRHSVPVAELRHNRCDALGNPRRIEGQFSSCHVCQLPDPAKVACIPLRSQRTVLGLLQLTYCEKRSFSQRPTTDESIVSMAADQLSLSLLNNIAKKNVGEKVMRDGLTGAFNRRYMEDVLQRELARSIRSKSPLSVLMVDLDHFKQLNDQMGHATGDLVLREVANILMKNLRTSDVVCRYGGEEFLVAMPDTSSLAARNRADELRRHIHDISKMIKHHRLISASIGVASSPEHATDLKTLMRAADDALYEAKKTGRDKAVLARSLRAKFQP